MLNIPLQKTSKDILDQKYCLKDSSGKPLESAPIGTLERVAKELASIEKDPKKWEPIFLDTLKNGAVPAGRIISNAGATKQKKSTSTINCTVSGSIGDSMKDILAKVSESGLTLKAGCGIGYEFSTLRPSGAYVSGSGSTTSGPLSFMDIFDKMCFTVSSAGGRRGAQMATFDVSHPDVMSFIKAKREDGRFRQFNLSLLITDAFVGAVKNNKDWKLCFPASKEEIKTMDLDIENPDHIIYKEWPVENKDYLLNSAGEVAHRVYETIKASKIWDLIMESTYDFAEPGFILIDEVNRQNNNWFCENIRSTNPCGEQPLPAYGSCLLGSINLTNFVKDPFGESPSFDFSAFKLTVTTFTRMLDNVVEINGLPLKQQKKEIVRKRRHGMGFFGLGSALTMMKIPYGSKESLKITEEISYELAVTGWEAGLELSKEKGAAPIMDEIFEVTPLMLKKKPEMIIDGHKVGDKLPGRILHAKYSEYMKKIGELNPQLIKDLSEHGARFTHHTSIAPTGTIALTFGNNASNGIEPSFSHHYTRNVIVEGRNAKVNLDVFSYELLAYRALVDSDALNGLPEYFTTSDDVTPSQHVDVQAASQKWVDSSISKTANVPTDFDFDEFKGIYLYAYDKKLKGCTTFRYNPEVFQGVLVKKEDLENTFYEFDLENGEKITVPGNEEIEYNGQKQSAANLFDALKENFYGKL